MAQVKFVYTDSVKFTALTEKDAGTLYFLSDSRQLFKGAERFGGGVYKAVTAFPAIAEAERNTLYVNTATGEVQFFDGTAMVTVVKPLATAVSGAGDDAHTVTSKALVDYVADQIKNLNTGALADRVTSVEGRMTTAEGKITAAEKAIADNKAAADKAIETANAEIAKKANDADLAAVAKSGKAADVAVADEAGKIEATDVEGALAEIVGKIEDAEAAGAVTVETATDPAQAGVYVIKQNGKEVGRVNIPKDMVATAGEIVKENATGDAGTFIKLTIANGEPFYIDVKDLIEYNAVESSDEITLTDTNHVIKAEIKAVSGAKLTDGTVAKTKLDKAVQASLDKADTAIQSLDSVVAKATTIAGVDLQDSITADELRTALNVADGAEVNQNAISNVKVGEVTVAADSKTDTVEIAAGEGIAVTADAATKKVTVATTGLATDEAVKKVAADLADEVSRAKEAEAANKTAAATAQAAADKANKDLAAEVERAEAAEQANATAAAEAKAAATQALTDAKAYTDSALTWGSL